MDTFVALTLVGVGGALLLFFALPMLYFGNLAVLNTTAAGTQARAIAVNQTNTLSFLIGLLGYGYIWYVLILLVAVVFIMVLYAGRRR
jgi:hypothetical protein